MDKLHIIQTQQLLRGDIFEEPQVISFKKGQSLNDMLIRAITY